MDLDQARHWLDGHLNLEATAGRIEGLSLDGIRSLLHALDDPQDHAPVIHVTGTNGKGSVTRMIAALLSAQGLSVGTYTSPHLQRLNERLWWSGEPDLHVQTDGSVVERGAGRRGGPISDDELAAVLTAVARAEPLAGVTASWFELMTAAAFTWFAELPVDVAVVEVGLLGRFDATNAADAAVAVITNIAKDHTDGQGDWRRAVAGEKAGIIKPGTAVVLGEADPSLRDLFEAELAPPAADPYLAAAGPDGSSGDAAVDDERGEGGGDETDGAAETDGDGGWGSDDRVAGPAGGVGPGQMVVRGDDFDVEAEHLAVGGRLIDVRTPTARYEELFLPLHGVHQAANAAIAVAAVEAFFGRPLDDDVVREALATVRLPGRFEVVGRRPLVVLDGAHNPAGAAAAAATLAEDFEVRGRRILVVGLLGGRDTAELLAGLGVGPTDRVIACAPESARAVPADEVAATAADAGAEVAVVPDVAAAVDTAVATATADDVVVITGSLYVVGAARTALDLDPE